MTTQFLKDIIETIGHELTVDNLGRELGAWAQFQTYKTVGAMLVSCADETEREQAEAFQREFVDLLLPRIATGHQAPFRLANLGGRYEPGALTIAEDHFDLIRPKDSAKLMVVKVNSHVGILEGPTFGQLKRYGEPCVACGAISALLKGNHALPFAQEMGVVFQQKRLAHLQTMNRSNNKGLAYLFAAITNSLLQTQRVVSEILNQSPGSLTHYLVLSCVTLNQYDTDSEIVCGVHWVERADAVIDHKFWGLPDDPARLALLGDSRPLQVGVVG